MRLAKTLKAENYYEDVEVKLTMKTRHLMSSESKRDFNKVLDRIAKALFEFYNFQDIKLK